MKRNGSGFTWLVAATVLLSAFLLFLVQPTISKMILPWFGGSPAVWTTCMLFFQVLLLAGYGYAHLLETIPTSRVPAVLHAALLLVAVLVLPITPAADWKPVDSQYPQLRILWLLLRHVGLPYFLLASTAPLIQSWFSRVTEGRSPYRLYALSNAGSLGALLAFPFLIEPAWSTPQQGAYWSAGFRLFALTCGFLAMAMYRWNLPNWSTRNDVDKRSSDRPGVWRFLVWLLLPAFASMSLLAVTNQICQDVAVVPFLWVAPLSLYLLTFVICFDAERWYFRFLFCTGTLVAGTVIAAILMNESLQVHLDVHKIDYTVPDFLDSLSMEIYLYLALLFFICMVCHGELVRSRPSPRYLTSFYLSISAGGALGGCFVALVCPRWFTSYAESMITLVGGCLLAAGVLTFSWFRREWRWRRWWPVALGLPFVCLNSLRPRGNAEATLAAGHRFYRLANMVIRRRPVWTWVSFLAYLPLAPLMILPIMLPWQTDSRPQLAARRNFYGVLRVVEFGKPGEDDVWRRCLYNGRILHGVQWRSLTGRRQPTTYYADDSGIGLTLNNLSPLQPMRVATVGLGTGTTATYGRTGDDYTFYEINPEVEDICREYFTYLSDSAADVHVVIGDARLSMENRQPQNYDVIALDAFTGDAIPAHLLTVEAFGEYLRHLKSNGVIAVHTSNRHLDLEPIVALLADHYQLQAVAVYADDAGGLADSGSDWLLVTNNVEFLNDYVIDSVAVPLEVPGPEIRVWTDQYSNLFQILIGDDEDE